MFRRYIEDKEYMWLPLAGNLLVINTKGELQDNNGSNMPTYLNDKGELVIKFHWIDGYKEYRICLLVAFTFKPVNIPVQYWKQLDVMFVDEDKTNLHPSNLIWKFPNKGIKCRKLPGFYYIPGFTKYVINKKGVVIRHFSNKQVVFFINKLGYRIHTLPPDIGPRHTVGRFRLLALTFLGYCKDVDKMHVNHIDEDSSNDDLSNLEWTTAKQNNHHSLKLGKIRHDKEIEVLHVSSNVISSYYCLTDVANLIGTSTATVSRSLKHNDQRILPNGFVVKYKTDEWETIDYTQQDIDNVTYRDSVLVRNVLTGEELEFVSGMECAKFYGLSDLTISNRLRDNQQKIYSGFLQFKRKCDPTSWKEIKDPVQQLLKSSCPKEIYVRNFYTKEIQSYKNMSDASKATGISLSIIQGRISNGSFPALQFQFSLIDIWKEYDVDQCSIIDLAYKRNIILKSNFAYKVTDTTTGQVEYYISSKEVASVLNIAKAYVSTLVKSETLVKNKYNVSLISL